MEVGIVSNCWRAQLESGASLDELIAEGVRRGYPYVELREGCLGGYESPGADGMLPDVGALSELARRFPSVAFNVALAVPFYAAGTSPASPHFQAGLRGALALGGGASGHLRLVDPVTEPEAVTEAQTAEIAERLAALAAACGEAGARLSVENARQPWAVLRSALMAARARLGSRAGTLGLCYDPCNILSASDRPDPQAVTNSLRTEEILLFHFKQSRAGAAHPEVASGDVDWPAQLEALQLIGYTGPRLCEIPAGPDIWDRLERSRQYLEGIESES
jgi:sugar phosphate isomerase/epimerase